MSRPPRQVSRLAEVTLAGSCAVVGVATVVLRLLAKPTSRLSRFVDRNLPEGITR